MNCLELKEFFDQKVAQMEPSEETESLDYSHRFLAMAIYHIFETNEATIGNFELPNKGIKYDGVYFDEDEKVYHIFLLIYINDLNDIRSSLINQEISLAREGANNLIKAAMRGRSNISTTFEVGEHVQDIIDAIDNGTSICFDFFSNIPINTFGFSTEEDFGNPVIQLRYFDGEAISESINADETEELKVDFSKYGSSPLGLKVSENEDFDVYLSSISGKMLAAVYKDHKSRLMDGNVRAYLKRTQKTNKGISETIKTCPKNFVAFNNGISAVATSTGSEITAIGNKTYLINVLSKLQIVNGGQTTVTIYESALDPVSLEEIQVPLKLTVLKKEEDQEDLVSNIAIYANTQTAIAKSDLASNMPFYKKLETLSQNTPIYKNSGHTKDSSYYWFFERTNGLYNTKKRIIWNYSKTFDKKFPSKNKFSKKVLAKSIMAFSQRPFLVCLGNENCFKEFNNEVERNELTPDLQYYQNSIASIILWQATDKIVKAEGLPIKAAIVPYTISYFSFIMKNEIDLNSIWINQCISAETKHFIREIAKRICFYFEESQKDHPNILMWGRKEECWETIKRLNFAVSLCFPSKGPNPISFFPENPVLAYIADSNNYNNRNVWEMLLTWSQNENTICARDLEKVTQIINQIIALGHINDVTLITSGKKIFVKMVQKGYKF